MSKLSWIFLKKKSLGWIFKSDHIFGRKSQSRGHCTEVRFGSLFSSGFITVIIVNPPERKLAKRIPVNWFIKPLLSSEDFRWKWFCSCFCLGGLQGEQVVKFIAYWISDARTRGARGARGATGPQIFGRSVFQPGEGILSPPITTGPLNVFHLPASLTSDQSKVKDVKSLVGKKVKVQNFHQNMLWKAEKILLK